eukprot:gene12523-biopygen14409
MSPAIPLLVMVKAMMLLLQQLLFLLPAPIASEAARPTEVANPVQWRAIANGQQNIFVQAEAATNATMAASPHCRGSSCSSMSDMLPRMQFKEPKRTVKCSCSRFTKGKCFAPGCFVCAKSCFIGDLAFLANAPGPFGTGLLCSSGCLPCCQRVGDASKVKNSTCDLVGTGYA